MGNLGKLEKVERGKRILVSISNIFRFLQSDFGSAPGGGPPPLTKVQGGSPPAWIVAIRRAKRAGLLTFILHKKGIASKCNMIFMYFGARNAPEGFEVLLQGGP